MFGRVGGNASKSEGKYLQILSNFFLKHCFKFLFIFMAAIKKIEVVSKRNFVLNQILYKNLTT